jgi:lipopolysaccharide/colanic/teichoic acid biosynthesis glycosyltransferase
VNNANDNGLPPWKRTLDVLIIIAALPLLVPLSLSIALLIRLVSRGPICFSRSVWAGAATISCASNSAR